MDNAPHRYASRSRGRATTSATSTSTSATWSVSGTATSSSPRSSGAPRSAATRGGWRSRTWSTPAPPRRVVKDYDAVAAHRVRGRGCSTCSTRSASWLLCRNASGDPGLGARGGSSRTRPRRLLTRGAMTSPIPEPARPGRHLVHARAGPGHPHPRGRQPRRRAPQPAAPGLRLERDGGRPSRLGARGLHRDPTAATACARATTTPRTSRSSRARRWRCSTRSATTSCAATRRAWTAGCRNHAWRS